jgi:BlaI family penicillinase repressor
MSNYPTLTDADHAVMEILWREGEADSAAVVKELIHKFSWSRQTVRTYLKRLIDKGLVATREKNKRDYIYYPIVSKEEYGVDTTSTYLNKYFRSLTHMVSGLIQKEDISEDELNSLEQLIKDYKEKK